MSDQIIKTNTGSYGRVNVVLPIPIKDQMLNWMNQSGMKKAQFFRTALMIGTVQLAQQLGIEVQGINPNKSRYSEQAQQPARR